MFYRLLLALILWGVVIVVKASVLAGQFEADSLGRSVAGTAISDLSFLGMALLLAALLGSFPNAITRFFCRLFILIIAFVYAADFFTSYFFKLPLSPTMLVDFAAESYLIRDYVDWGAAMVLLAIVLGALIFPLRYEATLRAACCGATFLVAPVFVRAWTPMIIPYSFFDPARIMRHSAEFIGFNQEPLYSPAEVLQAQAAISEQLTLELPASKPNILLVVVESLAASYSKKLGADNDYLGDLERLAQHGVLFKNFFTNYRDSEGARVALLQGTPPIPFPGANRSPYRSFNWKDSIIQAYKKSGYYTELLTTADLSFLSEGEYFRSVGFDRVRGQQEVPLLRKAPHAAFLSPADEYLYEEALQTINNHLSENRRFLLVLFTTSSHFPWKDPGGSASEAKTVLSYVSRQIHGLYDQLDRSGFFSNGIMLVLGDHRQWGSDVDQNTREAFGDSADARVFATAIGTGIPSGIEDTRWLSMRSLLPKLARIIDHQKSINEPIIYVDRYSQYKTNPTSETLLQIFDERWPRRSAKIRLSNGWLKSETPDGSDARDLEKRIHQWRAYAQAMKAAAVEDCGAPTPTIAVKDTTMRGLSLYFEPGRLEDRPLSTALSRIEQATMPDFVTVPAKIPIKEHFTLIYLGNFLPESAGEYYFNIRSDDGVCVFADQKLRVSDRIARTLSAGWHEFAVRSDGKRAVPLEIRYFNVAGPGAIELRVFDTESGTFKDLPRHWLLPAKPLH